MEFKFHCIHCGQSISVAPEQIGQQGACPACNQTIIVPNPFAEAAPTQAAATLPTPSVQTTKPKRLFEPYMYVSAFGAALVLFFLRECRKIEMRDELKRRQQVQEEQNQRIFEDAYRRSSTFTFPQHNNQ